MRLFILLLIVIAGYGLIRRWFRAPRPAGELSSTEMVQDPNCEIYVPETEAVKATIGGRDYLFCSEKCATEYRNKHSTV